MAQENFQIKMDTFMKEIGLMDTQKDKELKLGTMIRHMRVNLKKGKNKDLVS